MRILLFLIILTLSVPAQARDKFLNIQEITTPGGLKAWIVEDHTLPIVSLKFLFRDSGSALESPDKQGLTRLLSNTMDEGAGDLDSQTFQKALSDHSITLSFNAGRDGFGGSVTTLTRHTAKAFELLGLATTKPRFDAEPVERMRQANLVRVRASLSDPEWMAARLINDRGFEGHPYAMNSGGSLTTLASITADDLRSYLKTYLTRDRLIVSAAGDITPSELSAYLDRIFGNLPAGGPDKSIPDYAVKNTGKTYLYPQTIPQSIIEVMMPAFGRKDPDYFALRVLNHIFGESGFGSRLMEEVREKRGLTYGIYSSVDNYRHLDALTIATSTRNESAQEVLSVVKDVMRSMADVPVPETELQDAKSYLIGSMPLSLTSTESLAGMALTLQIDDLPPDYLDSFPDRINAVTVADIQRVARRILKPENMVIAIVGTPKDVIPTEIIKVLPNAQ